VKSIFATTQPGFTEAKAETPKRRNAPVKKSSRQGDFWQSTQFHKIGAMEFGADASVLGLSTRAITWQSRQYKYEEAFKWQLK